MVPGGRFCTVMVMLLWICSRSASQPLQLVNAFPNLGFSAPLFLTHSNDGTNRIFVVQQNGRIMVFPNDSAVTSANRFTFLNITGKLSSTGGEEGLLGLAFHPDYATNGYFYVNYTAPTPLRTVVARYSVLPGDPNKADSLSELKIIEINQPYSNHNGGMILFGTDGYLYIGMGDGGSGGDPQGNGQNLQSLLGKILRINVDTTVGTNNYGIPPGNPFAGNPTAGREEIFAWGMRNPWRFSQDPVTGYIFAGDVGQNAWEEVDRIEVGRNYGWRCYEGDSPYNTGGCGPSSNYTFPLKAYSNPTLGRSVTGGYVYRGYRRPDLVGAYIYADYSSGRIWQFRYNGAPPITSDSLLLDASFTISSFGVDQNNELYICSYSGGSIQRFAGNPPTGVGDNPGIPESFILEQNYPNPFNPSTRIQYSLPSDQYVSLKVHDVLGREVANLVDGLQASGDKSVDFNAENLSSGIYIYRLTAGPFVKARTMLLLR